MRVSRYQGEKNLKALVARLYRLDADDPAATEAAAGLVEANRHLKLRSRTLDKAVDEGALIAVPELAGTFDGRSSSPVPSTAAQVTRARAIEVLDGLGRDEEIGTAREIAEVDAVVAVLGSPEFKEAAGNNPELAKQAEKIQARIDERRERIGVVQQRRRRTMEDARKMVDALAERIDAMARDH
jgi:hypothetical protein